MSSVQHDPVSAPRGVLGQPQLPLSASGRGARAGKARPNEEWVGQSRSAGSGFRRSRSARPCGGARPPARRRAPRRVQDSSIVSLFWRVFLLERRSACCGGNRSCCLADPDQHADAGSSRRPCWRSACCCCWRRITSCCGRRSHRSSGWRSGCAMSTCSDPGARLTPTGRQRWSAGARVQRDVDRLEEKRARERAAGARRAGGRAETDRVELHDEVGQTMTGVLLLLERVSGEVPAARREVFTEVQEAVRRASMMSVGSRRSSVRSCSNIWVWSVR